jgi:transcriptional antiterminator
MIYLRQIYIKAIDYAVNSLLYVLKNAILKLHKGESILFRQSAEIFLDLRSIGIAGTFLTGNIIKKFQKDAY